MSKVCGNILSTPRGPLPRNQLEFLLRMRLPRTALTLGLAMLLAWLAGRWLGSMPRREGTAVPVSKFLDASLALLGLLLGFTFSLAIMKFDQRRLALLDDTNAIGDFYTCATLLKDPVRKQLQSVVRDYTRLRVHLASGQISPAEFENALERRLYF